MGKFEKINLNCESGEPQQPPMTIVEEIEATLGSLVDLPFDSALKEKVLNSLKEITIRRNCPVMVTAHFDEENHSVSILFDGDPDTKHS